MTSPLVDYWGGPPIPHHSSPLEPSLHMDTINALIFINLQITKNSFLLSLAVSRGNVLVYYTRNWVVNDLT